MDLHTDQSKPGGKADKSKAKKGKRRQRSTQKTQDKTSQPLNSTNPQPEPKAGSELITGPKRFEIVIPVSIKGNAAKKDRLSPDKPIASIEKDDSENEETKQRKNMEAQKRQELVDSVSTLEGRHKRHFMYHYNSPQLLVSYESRSPSPSICLYVYKFTILFYNASKAYIEKSGINDLTRLLTGCKKKDSNATIVKSKTLLYARNTHLQSQTT